MKITMTSYERDCGLKEKALYFCTFKRKYSLLFKQGISHFHFALGLAYYVSGPQVKQWLLRDHGAQRIVGRREFKNIGNGRL